MGYDTKQAREALRERIRAMVPDWHEDAIGVVWCGWAKRHALNCDQCEEMIYLTDRRADSPAHDDATATEDEIAAFLLEHAECPAIWRQECDDGGDAAYYGEGEIEDGISDDWRMESDQ